jgi:hypothetical protein
MNFWNVEAFACVFMIVTLTPYALQIALLCLSLEAYGQELQMEEILHEVG